MTYKFATDYGRIGTARGSTINAYYKFDGTVTDSSGNGLTLSTEAGTVRYCKISNLQALACKGGLALKLSAVDSATLQQTGARTVHAFLCPDTISGTATTDEVYGVGTAWADGDSVEANNHTVSFAFVSYGLQVSTEHGAGVNDTTPLPGYSCLEGVPVLITVTRDAGGSLQFYFNGTAMGAAIAANSPTGGGNSKLMVGGAWGETSNYYEGAIAELQFLDTELTAAQVLEDARKVMPWL